LDNLKTNLIISNINHFISIASINIFPDQVLIYLKKAFFKRVVEGKKLTKPILKKEKKISKKATFFLKSIIILIPHQGICILSYLVY